MARTLYFKLSIAKIGNIIIVEIINLNYMRKFARYLFASFFAFVLVAGLSNVTLAAEFVGPDPDSGNVTIPLDKETKNLYVAGGNVLVNGKTLGDLYVAGGNVTIEGNVEGDLVAAGGNLYLNGEVGGDVRVAGGSMIINSKVGGDVVLLGGSVVLNEKSSVGGDLIVNSGEANISSPVAGKLVANGGVITINSEVKGSVSIFAEQQLNIGSKTIFGQNAKYQSRTEAKVADGATLGGLQYEKITKSQHDGGAAFATVISLGFVAKLIAMIIVALIVIRLFPKKSHELVAHIQSHPWSNLGIGTVGFIVAPILVILLLITFVGFYLGLVILALWLLWSLMAILIGMVSAGAWINSKLTKKTELTLDWQAVVLGVVVISILGLIPVIGWLFVALVFLAGFGTILKHVAGIIRNQRSTVMGSIESN